ncbi:hypothetical protein Pcinc_041028 [Petrolisthes cinctipes]|uniref:Uncharacterized protein n=1 Tax=Petrolisthes cinctipes TaxID=88211 RepID=A0AAE1BKE7_PETCI|nr:hypothetical protein Pcinc_041028 [Petrolisthes cinctipes]
MPTLPSTSFPAHTPIILSPSLPCSFHSSQYPHFLSAPPSSSQYPHLLPAPPSSSQYPHLLPAPPSSQYPYLLPAPPSFQYPHLLPAPPSSSQYPHFLSTPPRSHQLRQTTPQPHPTLQAPKGTQAPVRQGRTGHDTQRDDYALSSHLTLSV